MDNCKRPLKEGSVVIQFSNGDPALEMISLNNGRWDGTWKTNPSELSDVTLRVEASQPSLGLEGCGYIRTRTVRSTGFALGFRPGALGPGSLLLGQHGRAMLGRKWGNPAANPAG